MRTRIILYVAAFFMVLVSCEKEALEAEIQEVPLHLKVDQNKAKQVLSFKAHLSGDQEVPPAETNATGQTIFKLSKDGTELEYKLIVANIENVTMAHIHVAPAGANGGVVAWLYPDSAPPQLIPGRTNGVLAEGIITSADLVGSLAGASLQDLIDLMTAGQTYVNVHTSQYGGGEIRGQISANNSK
jgi:hypothetical protein